MRCDVQADQRVERARAVAESHRRTVPERVFVIGAVVHAHGQLERQRRSADVRVVHVVDHAAEIMRIVERRKRAVDGLHRIARTGVRERGGARRAAVEVDRLHIGIVHGARGARLGHVHEAEVGAVFVLPGLVVAAGAGAYQRVLEIVELLQNAAAVGIDNHGRARRRAAAGGVGEERHDICLAGTAVVVDVDHQLGFFGGSAHETHAIAQTGAFADGKRAVAAQARPAGRNLGGETVHFLAEQRIDIAAYIFIDDDVFAEDRQAAERLLIAVIAHAAVGFAIQQKQPRVGVQTKRLRMTALPNLDKPLLGMDVLGRLRWQQDAGVMKVELKRAAP